MENYPLLDNKLTLKGINIQVCLFLYHRISALVGLESEIKNKYNILLYKYSQNHLTNVGH